MGIEYNLQSSETRSLHSICLPKNSLYSVPLNRAANLFGGNKTSQLLV